LSDPDQWSVKVPVPHS